MARQASAPMTLTSHGKVSCNQIVSARCQYNNRYDLLYKYNWCCLNVLNGSRSLMKAD